MKKWLIIGLMVVSTLVSAERAPDFLRIYEVLDVEYDVVEQDGRKIWANYNPNKDIIHVTYQALMNSPVMLLETVLHELIHSCNFDISRAPITGGYLKDTYFKEVVASLGANKLSAILWGGKYKVSDEHTARYLVRHPTHRRLTKKDFSEARRVANESVRYIIKRIKNLDVNNELGLQ